MSYGKVRGVILKARDFKEKDRLIYVATENYGKMTFIVKGTRTKNSRFASSTMAMNLCDIVYFEGKNIHSLNEISVIHSFPGLKNDFERITYGTYFLELMDIVTEDGEANERLFLDFVKALYLLETDVLSKELIARAFEIKVLLRTGNQPSPYRNGKVMENEPRDLIRFFLNKDLKELVEIKSNERVLNYIKTFNQELLKECFQRRPKSLDILELEL